MKFESSIPFFATLLQLISASITLHYRVEELHSSTLLETSELEPIAKTIKVSCPIIQGRIRTSSKLADGAPVVIKGGAYMYALNAFVLYQMPPNTSVLAKNSDGGGTGLPKPGPNGTVRWDGVIGDLLSKKADLGVVTGLTFGRSQIVDFSPQAEVIELDFVVKKSLPVHRWQTIVMPLKPDSWALFGAIAVLAVIVIKISKPDIAWNYSAALVLRGSLEESGPMPKGSAFVGMILVGWMLFSLNVCTLYKSKFFQILTFPPSEPVPRTFEELAAANYKVGLQYNGGVAFHVLKTSKFPAVKKIVSKLEVVPGDFKCFENVAEIDRYACIAWGIIREYNRNANFPKGRLEQQQLVPALVPAYVTGLGFSVAKKSWLLQPLRTFVPRVTAAGLMDQWLRIDMRVVREEAAERWRVNRRNGTSESEEGVTSSEVGGPKKLSIAHMAGCFGAWVIGVSLASIGAFIEVLNHKLGIMVVKREFRTNSASALVHDFDEN